MRSAMRSAMRSERRPTTPFPLALVTAAAAAALAPLAAGCPVSFPGPGGGAVLDDYAGFAAGGSYLRADPCLSPDGKWLAYSSPRTGRGDLYLLPFPGARAAAATSATAAATAPRARRVTSSDACDLSPRFSPDSRLIVFIRQEPYPPPRGAARVGGVRPGVRRGVRARLLPFVLRRHLFTVRPDGGGLARRTGGDADDYNPVFSPDGREVWFSRVDYSPGGTGGGVAHLYALDLATGAERRVLPPPPAVPVSDSRVAFLAPRTRGSGAAADFLFVPYAPGVGGGDVHRQRLRPDRQRLRPGQGPPPPASSPVAARGWDLAASPDGRKFAFVSDPYGRTLWVCRPDGSWRRKVYERAGRRLSSPTFTPDGASLVLLETDGAGGGGRARPWATS